MHVSLAYPPNKINSSWSRAYLSDPKIHNTTHTKRKQAQTRQKDLANISNHMLSAAETSLLKKGLSFVPTPHKITTLNYEESLMKLKT